MKLEDKSIRISVELEWAAALQPALPLFPQQKAPELVEEPHRSHRFLKSREQHQGLPNKFPPPFPKKSSDLYSDLSPDRLLRE